MSFVTFLECPKCGRRLEAERPQNLCSCGSPLLVRYDLPAVKRAMSSDAVAARARGLWRFEELLPGGDPGSRVELGEGDTPLAHLPRLGQALGLRNVLLKDEGLNPTGTFKARGAAMGVSRAKELGIKIGMTGRDAVELLLAASAPSALYDVATRTAMCGLPSVI